MVVHDPRVRWSVAVARVVRIVPAVEWAAPAVDALATLGPLPRPSVRGGRVVIVRSADGRETALVAAGAIDVTEVDAASVLALPGTVAEASPQVSAIIVASDASLSLLLELTALTAPTEAITPDDTVVGEDLCPSHS